jgi:CRISPR-associated endonuclease Cas1
MIHHLILLEEKQDLQLEKGMLRSGSRKIAIETLGSLQCFSNQVRWSQAVLNELTHQCPVVMSSWHPQRKKWNTYGLSPRERHVNPEALARLCSLKEKESTKLASKLLYTKVCNQHFLLRSFNPRLSNKPDLKESSFNRILRLEAQYARFFWPRYFDAMCDDLFHREKRKPKHPLNAALSYGYGYLYHAICWECLGHGLETSVGLIHQHRKNRPSLACDLIEPLRCIVELTLLRNWEEMPDKQSMAGRFAEMMEDRYVYKGKKFRVRTIVRLMVESFIQSLLHKQPFVPFQIDARDACL